MALSSDVLERQRGPTKLEILQQDEQKLERIICTKTASGLILELSKVIFRPEGVAAFPKIHQRVIGGTSMGAAFTKAALDFKRDVHTSYPYDRDDVPVSFGQRFGTHEPPTVTDLTALVGPDDTPYADILEVYSPKVSPWEPRKGQINKVAIASINDFGATLAHIT